MKSFATSKDIEEVVFVELTEDLFDDLRWEVQNVYHIVLLR